MTGIFVRVKRGDSFLNLDVAEMTLREIGDWLRYKEEGYPARVIKMLAEKISKLVELDESRS